MLLPSSRLFRSRWSALAWAAGILWFTFQVAGSTPGSGKDNAAVSANAEDLSMIANALGS